jgi:hypothetical protein
MTNAGKRVAAGLSAIIARELPRRNSLTRDGRSQKESELVFCFFTFSFRPSLG